MVVPVDVCAHAQHPPTRAQLCLCVGLSSAFHRDASAVSRASLAPSGNPEPPPVAHTRPNTGPRPHLVLPDLVDVDVDDESLDRLVAPEQMGGQGAMGCGGQGAMGCGGQGAMGVVAREQWVWWPGSNGCGGKGAIGLQRCCTFLDITRWDCGCLAWCEREHDCVWKERGSYAGESMSQ